MLPNPSSKRVLNAFKNNCALHTLATICNVYPKHFGHDNLQIERKYNENNFNTTNC
jgi:hypothetical protein